MPCRLLRHPPVFPLRRRGVTFLEILVVMTILLAFAALTVPTLQGVKRRSQLAASAREVSTLARYGRQQAVLRNHTTELTLDIPGNRYQLRLNPDGERRAYNSGSDALTAMESIRHLDESRKQIYFQKVESATDPFGREQKARIRFFKDGSASPSTIVVANAEKGRMTIEIAGASGSIRVYAGAPEEKPVFAEDSETEGASAPGGAR